MMNRPCGALDEFVEGFVFWLDLRTTETVQCFLAGDILDDGDAVFEGFPVGRVRQEILVNFRVIAGIGGGEFQLAPALRM